MSDTPITPEHGPAEDLSPGNRCLMNVMEQRFLVDVLDVSEKGIRVSFPGLDYPVAGMCVDLEFHDTEGINCYSSRVLAGPSEKQPGVLLEQPSESLRTHHRNSCRVTTDLVVQVKDQVHVRRYDADLLNVSATGALIETAAPFDFNTTVEMTLSLPDEPASVLLASVVHITESTRKHAFGESKWLYGLRFVSPDPQVSRSLTRYVAMNLRKQYSAASRNSP